MIVRTGKTECHLIEGVTEITQRVDRDSEPDSASTVSTEALEKTCSMAIMMVIAYRLCNKRCPCLLLSLEMCPRKAVSRRRSINQSFEVSVPSL